MGDELKTGRDGWPDVLVIRVPRDLRDYGEPELRRLLAPGMHERPVRIALDMSNVVNCRLASLNVLMSAMKFARQADGDVRLFAVPHQVTQVLQRLVPTVFRCYANEDEAVASFQE